MGIDDFAFKKRMAYGTIFIDLQTNKPIDLLEKRDQIPVTEWLKNHPEIELITRDGSKTYAKAVTEASPAILQVGDRWHILHQLFEAIKKTIFNLIPAKWTPTPIDKLVVKENKEKPPRKSESERLQNEEKRWARIQHVQLLYEQGYTITSIKRKLHLSRGTIYADLKQKEKPNHQRATPYQRFDTLIQALLLDSQTGNQIEEACRLKGYTGSRSTLNKMIARERRNVKQGKAKTYSVRQKVIQVIWDFKKGHHLERIGQLHPELPESFPEIIELDQLVQNFRNLFTEKRSEKLVEWLAEYKQLDYPFIQSFIHGIEQDISSVKLSIQEPWSNG
ncbi:transposase, partial [Sporosarcina limicola]|nr:transposase [Sporosarcina limicola]